tara:strand:+ start:1821 stop:2426 length:606 start_codon:yes stop_codon:yes gene_type:complete
MDKKYKRYGTGTLNKSDILQPGSPFTASFGEISTNTAWQKPTKSVVDEFQKEWFSQVDMSKHDIWLVGGYRESLERSIGWTTWDVDYVVNGPINKSLEMILTTGLSLGFKYKILVDVTHNNISPWDYALYNGVKTLVEILKPYKTFRKDMNGKYYQFEHKNAEKIDNLNLYKMTAEFPSKKQLSRIDDWYQYPPLKINGTN